MMIFHSILTNWYSVHKRDLPWRTSKNPYNIWLSEIILQQTQVKQGLPYYEAFLAKPTHNNVEIFDLIRQWAKEKGILDKGDPKTQLIKLYQR